MVRYGTENVKKEERGEDGSSVMKESGRGGERESAREEGE